jgi:hypothetical protein
MGNSSRKTKPVEEHSSTFDCGSIADSHFRKLFERNLGHIFCKVKKRKSLITKFCQQLTFLSGFDVSASG